MSGIVLITGATGFVAGCVAASLLRSSPIPALFLVRGDSEDEARERLTRSVVRFAVSLDDREYLARRAAEASIITGDLIGFTTLNDRRIREITHVIHAAACASFRSFREVRKTNVMGTMAFVHRLRAVASIERFVHVSTAYCCGSLGGKEVKESDPLDLDSPHVAEYTRTKAEAEFLLGASAHDVPVVVARPSIVIGHTSLGCSPSSSLFWYYRALSAIGRAPFLPVTRRDIVPVDYVDAALRFLLFRRQLRHRAYHISAGERSSVTWARILSVFGKEWGPPYGRETARVSPEEVPGDLAQLEAIFGTGETVRLARGLVACGRFGSLDIEWFDNARLLQEGMPPPPCWTDYLPLCIAGSKTRSIYDQLVDDA